METNRSACFSFLALSKVAEQIPLIGEMALAPKGLPPRLNGWAIYLAFPKVAGKVARGDSRVTIEDCCLIFRKSFFNKDDINY